MLKLFKSFELNKDFCVWIVPPVDGRVHKVRCSGKRVACILSLAFIVAISFMFVAGDYTRVQLQRAKLHFTMSHLLKEKENLARSNESLQNEVKSLQGLNHKVLTYEQNVRQRVEELAWILDSAGVLGAVKRNIKAAPLQKQDAKNSDGLGGAELDCESDPSQPACLRPGIGGAEIERDSELLDEMSSEQDGSLVDHLDQLIEALKSLPIGLPGPGYINSGYGYRISPFTGRPSIHQGVDLALPMGSEVTATAEGYVHSVRRTGTYGLAVDIVHENGIMTRYAHLSRALVNEGDRVCRGEMVGLVGSSGRSTGPHLHYEVWVGGKPRNPETFMKLSERLAQLALLSAQS
ncbi:MAG: M23 family metallopeptidase [Bdellovibrionota bacterium]|nr:MAG: M23 family metallopeptidase [Bdellovibrionota bacterium]